MACLRLRPIVAAMVASSLIVSSTGAVAATAPIPASAAPQAVNPWATLSALSAGAPAAALCGSSAATAAASAAAAAQAPAPGCVLPVVDQAQPPAPVPVPPVEPVGGGFGISPLVLALGALAAAALIYFLVRDNNDNEESPT